MGGDCNSLGKCCQPSASSQEQLRQNQIPETAPLAKEGRVKSTLRSPLWLFTTPPLRVRGGLLPRLIRIVDHNHRRLYWLDFEIWRGVHFVESMGLLWRPSRDGNRIDRDGLGSMLRAGRWWWLVGKTMLLLLLLSERRQVPKNGMRFGETC